MALTSVSEILNDLTGGGAAAPQVVDWNFARGYQSGVVNQDFSCWRNPGTMIGSGATVTTVAAPTNATAGALQITNASGGRTLWLVGAEVEFITGNMSSIGGTLLLYDRLLHIGGLSGTSVAAQTVGGSLTRYTGTASAGNEIWVEIQTLIGSTARTITASYTDQDNNSGTTKATKIGSNGWRERERILRLPLAEGDTGVRAVASVTLSASTDTVGDFGVVVAHPLLEIPLHTFSSYRRDLIAGYPQPIAIQPDACLNMVWLAATLHTFAARGRFTFVEA